jgi:hypothetical protein
MNDREHMNADEKELLNALRALAREEAELGARPHIEAQLMRAWDENRGVRARRGRIFIAPFLKVAAALVLATSAAYWWSRGGANPPVTLEQRDQSTVMTSWPSSETLTWLDPEPGSLQIVHVRVASTTLAAQGYALSDPDGDGLVDLEVIVAADGTARGVRVAPATATIN